VARETDSHSCSRYNVSRRERASKLIDTVIQHVGHGAVLLAGGTNQLFVNYWPLNGNTPRARAPSRQVWSVAYTLTVCRRVDRISSPDYTPVVVPPAIKTQTPFASTCCGNKSIASEHVQTLSNKSTTNRSRGVWAEQKARRRRHGGGGWTCGASRGQDSSFSPAAAAATAADRSLCVRGNQL